MSADWTMRPFLCLDTETTGVNPFDDRIVQVAAVTVFPHDESGTGDTEHEWTTIVDPGVEIPTEAATIHGISTGKAAAEGVQPAEALTEVARRIWQHHETWEGQGAIVMYNARFDWPLILAEAERHGVDMPCFAPILDPYLIDRMVDRYRKGKRQLTLVADYYGVPIADGEAHDALVDATAAGRVMWRLLDRYPQIGEHTLATLWLRQVKGHEQDRQRFMDYMRQQVDPSFYSPPGWPIPAGVA